MLVCGLVFICVWNSQKQYMRIERFSDYLSPAYHTYFDHENFHNAINHIERKFT